MRTVVKIKGYKFGSLAVSRSLLLPDHTAPMCALKEKMRGSAWVETPPEMTSEMGSCPGYDPDIAVRDTSLPLLNIRL